ALADLEKPAARGVHAADEQHPQADEKRHRNDTVQQVAQERAFDLTGHHDVVLSQKLRDVWIDARRVETPLPAFERLLWRALDEAVGNLHLGDASAFEIALERTVGNLRHLLGGDENVLEYHEADESGDPVPDVELPLVHPSKSRATLEQT